MVKLVCLLMLAVAWLLSVTSARPSLRDATNYLHPQYHPMPRTHWMNDPNGPVYYRGYYHLFFQYNPTGSGWGDISWGHVASSDLAHWFELPVAITPDHMYDMNSGCWTGSITILTDGSPAIAYTCVNSSASNQCIALAKNPSDPLLVEWVKYDKNPVIVGPPQYGDGDFRDDTTAWVVDGLYVMGVGASINGTGSVLLYNSSDFLTWQSAAAAPIYSNSAYGNMFECPDLYAVVSDSQDDNSSLPLKWDPVTGLMLEPSPAAPGAVTVIKFSALSRDWYTLGQYDAPTQTFTPQVYPQLYDAGDIYASKRFFDPVKGRQILWAWVPERDSGAAMRAWQGTQILPRVLKFDADLKMLLSSPAEELTLLRLNDTAFTWQGELEPGMRFDLPQSWTQFEVIVTFSGLGDLTSSQVCAGLQVLADDARQQATNVSFSNLDAGAPFLFVNRSFSGEGDSSTFSAAIPFKSREVADSVQLRVFVDHSIVEAYANERVAIAARVYPNETSSSWSVWAHSASSRSLQVSVTAWAMDTMWLN